MTRVRIRERFPRRKRRPGEIERRPNEERRVAINPDDDAAKETVQAQRVQAPAQTDHAGQTLHVQVVSVQRAEHGLVAGHLGHCADQRVVHGLALLGKGFVDGLHGLVSQPQEIQFEGAGATPVHGHVIRRRKQDDHQEQGALAEHQGKQPLSKQATVTGLVELGDIHGHGHEVWSVSREVTFSRYMYKRHAQ